MSKLISISLSDARAYIDQLDLSYIINAMCAPEYPLPRWTRSDAEHGCFLYKNFLYLQKKHLPTPLVPTKEIDEFWHNHILFTKQYFADCTAIFGHYLHHQPAIPGENVEQLVADFTLTKELYLKEYKHPLHTPHTQSV